MFSKINELKLTDIISIITLLLTVITILISVRIYMNNIRVKRSEFFKYLDKLCSIRVDTYDRHIIRNLFEHPDYEGFSGMKSDNSSFNVVIKGVCVTVDDITFDYLLPRNDIEDHVKDVYDRFIHNDIKTLSECNKVLSRNVNYISKKQYFLYRRCLQEYTDIHYIKKQQKYLNDSIETICSSGNKENVCVPYKTDIYDKHYYELKDFHKVNKYIINYKTPFTEKYINKRRIFIDNKTNMQKQQPSGYQLIYLLDRLNSTLSEKKIASKIKPLISKVKAMKIDFEMFFYYEESDEYKRAVKGVRELGKKIFIFFVVIFLITFLINFYL